MTLGSLVLHRTGTLAKVHCVLTVVVPDEIGHDSAEVFRHYKVGDTEVQSQGPLEIKLATIFVVACRHFAQNLHRVGSFCFLPVNCKEQGILRVVH